MAEIIGLFASITAIVGAAGAAAKLAKSLHHTARRAGSAREEIQLHALNTVAFSSAVLAAHDMLRTHFQKQSHSSVISYVQKHQVLENVENHSALVTKLTGRVRAQVRKVRSRYKLLTGLKWYFYKPDVDSLNLAMEAVKSSLSILLHLVTLEAALQKEPSIDTMREM